MDEQDGQDEIEKPTLQTVEFTDYAGNNQPLNITNPAVQSSKTSAPHFSSLLGYNFQWQLV